jgi:DHA3 family tetracycline resistance protein-like MFS transporter
MRNAYTTYLTMIGVDSAIFWFIFTVNMIYQATVVGLDPLQLVLVGTTLEATVFFFEVPTGVVADVYSRKLSIVVGYVMIGIGFIVEGAFPFFATVLLAQVIWGAGWTFTSGATEAWLTDEIGEARAGRAFLRGAQIAQFTMLVGVAASVFLGNERVNLPILIGGVGFITLGVFLALAMPETGFCPTPREGRNSFAHMWMTFRDGLAMIRKRPALKTILGVSLFWGLHSEGVDRLWTPFLLTFEFPLFDGLTTVAWFGIIRIASALIGIAVNEIVHRRVKMDDESSIRHALFALNGFVFVSLVLLALSLNFPMAVAAYLGWSLMRQTGGPLHAAWVNQRLDSQTRATVNSLSAQVDSFGQMIGGPIVGAIGAAISLRAALVSSAAIFAPVLALFARARREE